MSLIQKQNRRRETTYRLLAGLVWSLVRQTEASGFCSEYDRAHCGFQNAYLQSFAGEESQAQAEWFKMPRRLGGASSAELARAYCPDGGIRRGACAAGECLYLALRWPTTAPSGSSRPRSTAPPSAIARYANGNVGQVLGEDNSYDGARIPIRGGTSVSSWLPPKLHLWCHENRRAVLAQVFRQDPTVREWADMQSLACGTRHVVGLTRRRSSGLAGILPAGAAEAIASWQNVTQLTRHETAQRRCIRMARYLCRQSPTTQKGSGSSGRTFCPYPATNVYGLTQDGNLLLAAL